jgi:hypothetical protein
MGIFASLSRKTVNYARHHDNANATIRQLCLINALLSVLAITKYFPAARASGLAYTLGNNARETMSEVTVDVL